MAGKRAIRRAPTGLGPAGRVVWTSILADVGDDWELDARELLVLESAARQADLNRSLEEALEMDGVRVAGVQGQPRLNGMATELRQGRIALEKLLGSLALPGEDGEAMTPAQKRAQAAGQARWMREGKRRRRHGA